MSNESRLVYSTETGRIKTANEPLAKTATKSPSDGVVRIRRETSGRKGKGVSVVTGLNLDNQSLQEMASTLKKLCGSGGAVKGDNIEIQGDHRQKIKQLLESRNYTVKLAGG